MAPEQERGKRFASWHKNSSWADITVCLKVRSLPRHVTGSCSPQHGIAAFHANHNSVGAEASRASSKRTAPLSSSGPSPHGSPNIEPAHGASEPRAKRARTEPEPDTNSPLPLVWDCEVVDEFPAHRLVLGSMSDVFKVQFDNWDKQLGARVSILLDSREELDAAHELLQYMYFEELSSGLDAHTIIKVAHLADQYQVLACLHACSRALCDLLSSITLSPPTTSNRTSASPAATSNATRTLALTTGNPPSTCPHSAGAGRTPPTTLALLHRTSTPHPSTVAYPDLHPLSSLARPCSDPNVELLLAAIMLEEHVGTPLPDLQGKATNLLASWFKDFDAAWNRPMLRALFLQLPRSYVGRLLAAPAAHVLVSVASENSVATALHFWAQAQGPGALTSDLSSSLLRLLHFQGLTTSYLTVVLPCLPTFSASPHLMRYIGEACRLKVAAAARAAAPDERGSSHSRDRQRERPRDSSSNKQPVHLDAEEWQSIVGKPMGMPLHFARRRPLPAAAATAGGKAGCTYTWTVRYAQLQELAAASRVAEAASAAAASSSSSSRNKPAAELCSPPRWHQGLMFITRLQLVPPHRRSSCLTASASGGIAAADAASGAAASRELADAVQAGPPAAAASSRDSWPDSDASTRANPKVQAGVSVQLDPLQADSADFAGCQIQLSSKFSVSLSDPGLQDREITKEMQGALFPLDGTPLWKALWRSTPAPIFDSTKGDSEIVITTEILDVN